MRPSRERVAQRGDDRLLADEVGEALRPPLARENLIGHWKLEAAADEGFRCVCGTRPNRLIAAPFRA